MTLELTVETEDAGTRLDAFIAAHAPELTRSQAARLIEEGAVTVGSARPAKSARVAPGETVAVRVPARRRRCSPRRTSRIDVVYEDEDRAGREQGDAAWSSTPPPVTRTARL